ncbi:MAG: EF-hand domain-containing protein [Methylococcaceae bacterium]
MKNKKIIDEVSKPINMNLLDPTNLYFVKVFSLPFWLVIMSISLSLVPQSVRAGTENIHRYYRYIPYEGPTNTSGTAGQRAKASAGASETEAKKTSPSEQKNGPVKKPEKDTGEFPSGKLPAFGQVDINGDHYITKDELQNFPELLQVFDKIDAGKDGRLEQHEYQNLEMETIREGEIS